MRREGNDHEGVDEGPILAVHKGIDGGTKILAIFGCDRGMQT